VCIPGVEISSKVDKCFEFVNPSDVYSLHILAYFPKSIYANFDIGKIKLLKEHKPNVFETLEFIHGIGGISVLAHPTRGVKKNTDPTTQLNKYTNISIPLIVVEKIIDTCVKNGLDGIEAYYEANSEDETAFLVSIAKKYDLLTSQGTDFHKFGDCITSKYDDTIKHDLIIKKLL
jgi:hypothetical protein